MMKIAMISDIHGNLEALKTVISDCKKRGVDRIFCLGDIIAKGTHSKECLDLIRDNCDVIIKGNTDDFFPRDHNYSLLEEDRVNHIKWVVQDLTKEDKKFLLGLPFSYEFYMSGSLVRMFHATPSEIYNFVAPMDKFSVKRGMFEPSEYTLSNEVADIVIYGHTHMQALNKFYNKTLINTGSVGLAEELIRNPKRNGKNLETTNAFYIIIEGQFGSREYSESLSINLMRVPYDIDKELSSEKENFHGIDYIRDVKEGIYKDMDKILKAYQSRGIDIDDI